MESDRCGFVDSDIFRFVNSVFYIFRCVDPDIFRFDTHLLIQIFRFDSDLLIQLVFS